MNQIRKNITEKIELLETLRIFIDAAAVYAYVVDADTDELLMVNKHYAKNLGVPEGRMKGRKCWEFVTGEDGGKCSFCPRSKEVDAGNILPMIEAFNPTLGIWGKVTAQALELANGKKAHLVTAIDISEEKLLRDELSRLAFYDKQLGVPNRAKIEKDIAARPEGNYCLIAFDYVSLRYVNDAYGRQLVNGLLDAVIRWIRSFELRHCEIYRIGGDEFCLMLDNTDLISASGFADRLHERFQEPWEIRIGGEPMTILCRIATCVIDGRLGGGSAENILAIADRTLDIAKDTQSVAMYDQYMDKAIKRDLALEVSLKNCVQNAMTGFDVYFQPITDPALEKWVGLEALCRWDSPEFGRIPPLVFIHIAERIGVINKLGYWVLDTAIEICARLGLCQAEDFFLDINLSPSQLSDETLINKVLGSLQAHGFPARCLSLEVTESQDLEAFGYSHTTIERLKSLDIKVALDDFGTGYSNFNNLRNLPVRILKTEKQFIDNIVTDDYQKFLMRVLVDLAHEADMSLIAEGVETAEQMKELLKNGADYFQGYLFAKPLTQKELAANAFRFREPDALFARLKREAAE